MRYFARPALLLLITSTFGCGDRGDDREPVDAGRAEVDEGPDADMDSNLEIGGDGSGDSEVVVYTEQREPCLDRNALRNLYWGDTHIHTRYSFDAYVIETRADPYDAYAFARGQALQIMPLDAEGEGTTQVEIDRPLDFAAVSDHAEYFAEIDACTDPDNPAYDTDTCTNYRIANQNTVIAFGSKITSEFLERFEDICAEIDCEEGMRSVWARIGEDAEAWYDRTEACEFTTFHAYEYSSAIGISNLHRNVIFRNSVTPDHVTSTFEEPFPEGLFERLYEDCIDAPNNCDVLAIPHNSNWSNGNMFLPRYPAGTTLEEQRRLAARRIALEPIVEIFQHKGDSECINDLASSGADSDPLCDFEKLRPPPFEDCRDDTGVGAMAGLGCTSRFDFVRYVLQEGLREADRLGVNPLQLGISAATDTHNGTPGMVDERGYLGHFGNDEIAPEARLADPGLTPGGIVLNPGGLTGVWAVENS